MEQYFLAASIQDEARKVTTATMYLGGDAKLWWRTKYADIQANRVRIDSWDLLKEAIRSQFFPENVEYEARRALRELKHTSSIREYVKAFSGHMLNIRDMSEKDKLFTFIEGLKPWTRTELQRQRVTDLSAAMGAAECLSDYHPESRKDRPSGNSQSVGGGNRPYRTSSNPSGGERYSQNKGGAYQGTRQSNFKGNYNSSNSNNWNKGKAMEGRSDAAPKLMCFLCEGPHRVAECPQKRMVNAYCQLASGGSNSKQDAPQTSRHDETDSEEEEDVVGTFSHRCNTISHRAAKRDDVPSKEPKMEESKARICRAKGLMYIDVKINGKPIRAMVDTGATHNYLASTEVERLGLVLEKGSGKVKAINSVAQPIVGIAKSVSIKAGPFEGRTNLSAVQMDDFKLILGLEFLRDTKTAVLPYADSLMMMGSKPCVITTQCGKMGEKSISAMQFSKGFKRNEPSFLCTLRLEEIEEATGPIPKPVRRLVKEFEDIMPEELPKKLPPRRAIDHEIELIPGAKPPARAPYRMSQPELEELRKQLGEMLESGIIVPAKSPYGAPVLFQKKADGSLRMCCDYRALNKITVKNSYPIPLVADCFDRLSRARYYTKIDLRSGYWQVRIKEGDEAKTTVVTRYGAFEFKVMPFGLTNAPATFCTMMNQVLHGFLDDFVVVYLDDIVIYSETLEEHVQHVRRVFNRLRENELYAKPSKCSFAQTSISFLGHIIEQGKIRMDAKKVTAIKDWQPPKNVHDVRSFLGLCNYYRRFVKGYSEIALPLTELTKKDKDWDWSSQCQNAFERLKKSMWTNPVLALPDMTKPFEVHTDASDFALGGVLMQEGHPVAYESRKLNPTERRYSAHEKELLAVVHCLRGWRHYLLGSPFIVKTDNTAVSHFMSQPKLSSKQARWQELLSEFNFMLEYRPGSSNHVADALSRRADLATICSMAALSGSTVTTSTRDQIRALLNKDPATQYLVDLIKQGKTRQFWLDEGLVKTKGDRLYVPKGGDLRKSLITECHDTIWAGHPGEERTFALLQRAYYWPQMRDNITTYVKTCLVCQQDKSDHQKKAGLLEPLSVPTRPFESVSMDYITHLPKVGDFSTIIVVVDRLSKYATFIAAPKYVSAEETAQLFFKHIVKYWGLPKDIVSDRDPRFTGIFWTELFKLLGSTLSMSSSFHPQSDGQTERFNSMLEEYLRHFISTSQKNWVKLLDAAQMCFNAQKSSSTNKSPFEIATGQQPLLPHTVDIDQSTKSPQAKSFSQEWKRNIEIARSYLEKAQKRYKKSADLKRRFVEFDVGDLVMVKLPDRNCYKLTRGKDSRLMPKYIGPLPIVKRVGKVAYRVALPSWCKIHKVLHVGVLKPYFADKEDASRNEPKRPVFELKRAGKKVVEEILDHRTTRASRKYHQEYLVKWRGCSSEENTWESKKDLDAFKPLIEAYHSLMASRTSPKQVGENVTDCSFT
jgi:hypothetical protein